MEELNEQDMLSKKIIVVDLDGTLTESKSDMDPEMADLIIELLEYKDIAVISGGSYAQFKEQFIPHMVCPTETLSGLYLFPTCAATSYSYRDGEWRKIYSEDLSKAEKERIYKAFDAALDKVGFKKPQSPDGDIIEDRGTQVTFSAFGQKAPLELKRLWDPDGMKRRAIIECMQPLIPDLEIRMGGNTSIDVRKKGIDKAYGIKKIGEYLNCSISDMLFIGDALFEGGNDYPIKQAGVDCISVTGPSETKRIFLSIITACSEH
jgi:HAD superfamily hydrolase (TIGR01484 family)